MRVLLVGSAEQGGISEHSAYLKEALDAADPSLEIVLHTALHPDSAPRYGFDICHVNYHSALHSQWKPEHFERLTGHTKTVVTWHDSGVPNSDHCKSIHAVADAFVVHEPCEDLPGAIYWRQGVPDWSPLRELIPGMGSRPVVGSIGFPFAWKNFDLLAEASALAGWGLVLIAPEATPEQIARWQALNPRSWIVSAFVCQRDVAEALSGCDATAFLYNTHNTGTSGAIRQGIAARKPVIASKFPFGRQFRDLEFDPLGARAITWVEPNLDNVVDALSRVRIAPIDAGMVALAARDSWANLGKQYAALYRALVTR